MSTSRSRITEIIVDILEGKPEGIRYTELINLLKEALPSIPENTLHGTLWNLQDSRPDLITRPDRGIYKLTKFESDDNIDTTPIQRFREDDFYEPFAGFLVNDLEDCTKAIPLGGNLFGGKWGTPDVIGYKQPRTSDVFKPPIEFVSAEIKLDARELITAFGQSCSYKLFSHKSYLVIPNIVDRSDLSKIESLCLIFGIGLILFDNTNIENPNFTIRVRPIKQDPDPFYTNTNIKKIADKLGL